VSEPTEIVAVVHPVTGEVIGQLRQQPPAVLAEVLFELREHAAEVKRMSKLVDDELRRRLETVGRKITIYGDYEVQVDRQWRRVWDADELESTLRDLVDRGAVHAGELTEVIRHETVVNGTEARRLLSRLSGDALHDLERCFRWHASDASRLIVARSVQLPTAEEMG
jgi:hypothetical protein